MALLCGRAFYLLECFLRQAVMLFVWFIASACPGRSEPARSGSSVFSHVHRAVALSTEIYCSVGGEAALCLGVTLHMNSHTALLVVLSVDSHRAVHLSFRSKSTAPKVDSPSHSSPHLFRPPPSPNSFYGKGSHVWKCCDIPTQSRCVMLMCLTLALSLCLSLSSVMSGQAGMWQHLSILPQLGVRGGHRAGADRWIRQPRGSGKRWEREQRLFPSFKYCMASKYSAHPHMVWQRRTAVRVMAVLHSEGKLLLLQCFTFCLRWMRRIAWRDHILQNVSFACLGENYSQSVT